VRISANPTTPCAAMAARRRVRQPVASKAEQNRRKRSRSAELPALDLAGAAQRAPRSHVRGSRGRDRLAGRHRIADRRRHPRGRQGRSPLPRSRRLCRCPSCRYRVLRWRARGLDCVRPAPARSAHTSRSLTLANESPAPQVGYSRRTASSRVAANPRRHPRNSLM